MMSGTALYLVLVGYLIRLAVRRIEPGLLGTWRVAIFVELLGVAVVPLVHGGNLRLLLIYVVALAAADLLLGTWRSWERQPAWRPPILLVSDLIFVLGTAVTFSTVPQFARFNYGAVLIFNRLPILFPWATWDMALIILGILLSTSWSHHLVSTILGRFHLMPSPPSDGAARGRMIGYLERAIIYVLIVGGFGAAIGFVIAAKTLARFKELQDKDFAEYFLIGTLASALPALVIGLLFRSLVA